MFGFFMEIIKIFRSIMPDYLVGERFLQII